MFLNEFSSGEVYLSADQEWMTRSKAGETDGTICLIDPHDDGLFVLENKNHRNYKQSVVLLNSKHLHSFSTQNQLSWLYFHALRDKYSSSSVFFLTLSVEEEEEECEVSVVD